MDCWLPRYIWFRVVVYTFVVDIWIVWELSSITVVFLHACISLVVLPSSKHTSQVQELNEQENDRPRRKYKNGTRLQSNMRR